MLYEVKKRRPQYMNIDPRIYGQARGECADVGYSMRFMCRQSLQEDDSHLYMVLAEKKSKPDTYTVWGFNSDSGGLFWGNYDLQLPQALELLANKLY